MAMQRVCGDCCASPAGLQPQLDPLLLKQQLDGAEVPLQLQSVIAMSEVGFELKQSCISKVVDALQKYPLVFPGYG